MKHVLAVVEAAAVAVLGEVPVVAASPAAQHFLENHPADAAYAPLAVGVAAWLYRLLKAKTKKAAVPPAAVPAPPFVSGIPATPPPAAPPAAPAPPAPPAAPPAP